LYLMIYYFVMILLWAFKRAFCANLFIYSSYKGFLLQSLTRLYSKILEDNVASKNNQ